jgi:hypothetical protein
MKVALFYTKNRSESSTFFTRKIVVKVVFFCIILFHLLGDDCQSIPIFFFVIFHKYLLLGEISQVTSICKAIVCTTRYEGLFFLLICLINSGYALVNQTANS